METITIAETDFHLLKKLISQKPDGTCAGLGRELSRARIVNDAQISPGVIRVNSHVELLDITDNIKLTVVIVMPEHADLKRNRVPVFAPICVGLIGQKENDLISLQTSNGVRSFKVLRVYNEQNNPLQ